MATNTSIPLGIKQADVPGAFMSGVQNVQKVQSNDTAEKINQLKIQAHKLDVLKELSGSVKDDAGLQRAKGFARSMGIDDGILGQLGDSYEQAKPLLDSFYANSDAAKTELGNQLKMLEFGMKQQQFQNETNPQAVPINIPGQNRGGLTPAQEQEYSGAQDAVAAKYSTTSAPRDGGNQAVEMGINNVNAAARDYQNSNQQSSPQLFKIGKEIVKLDEAGNPSSLSGRNQVPSAIQIANKLSDPNVPESEKENLRFAVRQTAQQAGDISRERESGKLNAQDRRNLPQLLSNGKLALDTIDSALSSKGFDDNFGVASYAFNRRGSDAADAKAFIDQIAGQNFLNIYETLKGGGQITEIEGRKGEAARTRLVNAQSPQEARAALTELRGIVSKGMELAKGQALGKPIEELVGMAEKSALGQSQGAAPEGLILVNDKGQKLQKVNGQWKVIK